jgi:signal-transduction protein with cAMP-binding, CBS, and nucleotidyltransferase domain
MVAERLEKHELFGLLSPTEIERLSTASSVVALKEGDRVYSEGHPASHLFVLLKGRVELRRAAGRGISFVVDDLLPGSIFGVSSLTGTERYLLNAECVEDSAALKIEAKVLQRILDQNAIVGYAMQRRISEILFKRYVAAMEGFQTTVQSAAAGRN